MCCRCIWNKPSLRRCCRSGSRRTLRSYFLRDRDPGFQPLILSWPLMSQVHTRAQPRSRKRLPSPPCRPGQPVFIDVSERQVARIGREYGRRRAPSDQPGRCSYPFQPACPTQFESVSKRSSCQSDLKPRRQEQSIPVFALRAGLAELRWLQGSARSARGTSCCCRSRSATLAEQKQ